jgi:hypothetical protein
MIDVWTIGGFGMTLLSGLMSKSFWRVYSRTGLKGFFYESVGFIVLAYGFLGLTIWELSLNSLDGYFEFGFFVLFALIAGLGAFISTAGMIMLNTSESGLYSELCEKVEEITFWQRITGDVPILKYEKPPPPTVSKRTMLILGITTMTLGSLLIMVHILFRIPNFTIHIFIPGTLALIFGLLIVIFSIIYLNKGKKSPE